MSFCGDGFCFVFCWFGFWLVVVQYVWYSVVEVQILGIGCGDLSFFRWNFWFVFFVFLLEFGFIFWFGKLLNDFCFLFFYLKIYLVFCFGLGGFLVLYQAVRIGVFFNVGWVQCCYRQGRQFFFRVWFSFLVGVYDREGSVDLVLVWYWVQFFFKRI